MAESRAWGCQKFKHGIIWRHLCSLRPCCSNIPEITHSSTIVSTFRDSDESGWDHEDGKSACPQYLATAQISLSSVKLCLAFNKVECCRDVWNATLRNHLMYFVLSPDVWILLASKFNCFMIYNVMMHLTVGTSYVLRRKRGFPQLTLVSQVLQKSVRHKIHYTYKLCNFISTQKVTSYL